jgi:hypothetical protein
MSTSLLYHGFGLVGYRYVGQTFQGGRVIFRIEQPRECLRCSQCGDADVWAQGGEERTFRTIPIGAKAVQIQFKVPRVLCFACGQVRQVKLGFADPKKRYTRSFARYALDLSRHTEYVRWCGGTGTARSPPTRFYGVSASRLFWREIASCVFFGRSGRDRLIAERQEYVAGLCGWQ